MGYILYNKVKLTNDIGEITTGTIIEIKTTETQTLYYIKYTNSKNKEMVAIVDKDEILGLAE